MIVDFRSDTVTQPTAAMKQAMVDAPLGDDVLGDEPTVQRLEATMAELTGKDAALFMPSGTMTNLVGIRVHTRAGDEVLMHAGAHPFNYEAAGTASFAGVQVRPLTGAGGLLDVEAVTAAIRPENDHFAPATLLCVEDTANLGGGSVYPLDRIDQLTALAHERGLKTHLDGARAFNAVVASGISIDRRARDFDSGSFCFSKGLGAPVGSVLVGDAEAMKFGRRVRKALGGGMRQSGMLAAACLYALEHNIARLADDHHNAKRLSDGLAALGFAVRPPDTNMVYVDVPDGQSWQDTLDARGVRCFATGPKTLRLVLHLDVDTAGVDYALAAFEQLSGE
jgi:threonine aldolase